MGEPTFAGPAVDNPLLDGHGQRQRVEDVVPVAILGPEAHRALRRSFRQFRAELSKAATDERFGNVDLGRAWVSGDLAPSFLG